MVFRWNQWNTAKVEGHGITPQHAEQAVRNAKKPYPQHREDEKWLVWGRTDGGDLLQVVYVLDEDDSVFVIHARPLTDREKKRFRRKRR